MVSLYEYFNTTNQTSPHYERHDNFVTDIKLPTCAFVQLLQPNQRCSYIRNTENCLGGALFIDYTKFYYCGISPEKTATVAAVMILLIILSLFIFLILGITADGYFCPSLKVLSKLMGLSEHVAGITLLAFGNCSPDLFTAIVGLNDEVREVYNDVLGTSVFVLCLVGAVIIIYKPFRQNWNSFMRDMSFLILDIVYLDYIIKSGNRVTLAEAILLVAMYIVYIITVLVDQYLVRRETKKLRLKSITSVSAYELEHLKSLESEGVMTIITRSSNRLTIAHYETPEETKRKRKFNTSNAGLFTQFFNTINIFNVAQWRKNRWFARIFTLIRLPIYFALTVFIPLVDYELELDGWTKLLNCIQILTLPALVALACGLDNVVLHIPIFGWIFIVSIPLGVLAFIFSRTDTPPCFHKLISVYGIIGSIFVIYSCAKELIKILELIGYITYRSNSYLGCTFLAWGNCVGDLIANIAMARQGYEKMGFAACMGSPLFNTLLTVGVIYTFQAASNPDYEFQTGEGTLGETSTIFCMLGLCVLFFSALCVNFEMRRSVGIVPLFLYGMYLGYCTLSEFEIIHAFGADHRLDQKAEPWHI